MIVFNLSCSEQHSFDGWFRSAEDYDRQAAGGLVECPLCGDKHITKQLSAPRINSGASVSRSNGGNGGDGSGNYSNNDNSNSNDSDSAASQLRTGQRRLIEGQEVLAASMMPGLQEHMLRQFKNFVLSNTENVGTEFAETARRIHYGEESQRNIRGRVSIDEAIALREEGIETVSLPPGVVLDEGMQ